MLVWNQREPWVRFRPAHLVTRFGMYAPDKLRRVDIRHIDNEPDCVAILSICPPTEGEILWQKNGNFFDAYFGNDDTLFLDNYREFQIYHRRFPEWWWGHFYRPEVWLSIVLSGLLVWKFITRALRFSASRPDASTSQPPSL